MTTAQCGLIESTRTYPRTKVRSGPHGYGLFAWVIPHTRLSYLPGCVLEKKYKPKFFPHSFCSLIGSCSSQLGSTVQCRSERVWQTYISRWVVTWALSPPSQKASSSSSKKRSSASVCIWTRMDLCGVHYSQEPWSSSVALRWSRKKSSRKGDFSSFHTLTPYSSGRSNGRTFRRRCEWNVLVCVQYWHSHICSIFQSFCS